jgi:hypothetical protein
VRMDLVTSVFLLFQKHDYIIYWAQLLKNLVKI